MSFDQISIDIKETTRILLSGILMIFVSSAYAVNLDTIYSELPCAVECPATVEIPQMTMTITDFGANGDGTSLCTEAIQTCIDKVAAQGGGHVIVPEGLWLFTPIQMKSNVDLHLEDNAIMVLTDDKTLFSQEKKSNRCLPGIWAVDAQNISITGNGIIDGNGKYWRPVKRGKQSDVEWKRYQEMGGTLSDDGKMWYPYNLKGHSNITSKGEKEQNLRADLVSFTNCKRILLKGITVQNSPRFHVHPLFCSDIVIDGISVRCPWNAQNGDGIDLTNCQRALITGCTVDVGDDGICLKGRGGDSGNVKQPSRDILIQDNKVYHAHGGFVLGSNIIGGMENIVVRHCSFSNTDTGLRFKSAIDRGGKTKNVYIYDIMMNDINNEAITFSCDYENKQKEGKVCIPYFQDIHIRNIFCTECGTGLYAKGLTDDKCVKDITIKDCVIYCRKATAVVDTTTADVKYNESDLRKKY